MFEPTVSVIIPCYNSENTIGETLESLQRQAFLNWEAVVVNDGSTDSSTEIIRRYCLKDTRISCIDQDNQGVAGARNIGLLNTKGHYINFLDADDLLLPNMLKRMVAELENYPLFGAVYCGYISSDPGLKDLSWTCSFEGTGLLFPKLAHGNPFPCHTILFRRTILDDVGIFDCTLKHCEDWDFWLRIARKGVFFGRVAEPLVVYRMLPASASREASSFYKAKRKVISRAHRPDSRVRNPFPKFAQGCNCSSKEALLNHFLRSIGTVIAQNNALRASNMLNTYFEKEGYLLSIDHIRSIVEALWIGSAIPKGNWHELWQKVGRPLTEFFLLQEEHIETAGFSLEELVNHLDIQGFKISHTLEKRSPYVLVKEFWGKLCGQQPLKKGK